MVIIFKILFHSLITKNEKKNCVIFFFLIQNSRIINKFFFQLVLDMFINN